MEKEKIKKLFSQIGLVSYVVTNNNSNWYVIPVDYWVMNHWGQWGISWNLSDEEKGEKFLELIDQFKVAIHEITTYYNNLEIADQENCLPKVYADFDKKDFYTNFGEWVLEDSLLESWNGNRMDVKELIVKSERYWDKPIN